MPLRQALAALILLLLAATGHPTDYRDRSWSFDGYGTLGVVRSSEGKADYNSDYLKSEGPGRSGTWSAGLDSRLAGQISLRPAPRVSAVVQAIVEQGFDGTFRPRLEWANVQYAHSPSVSVRIGRIALSTFLTSDHRKVGYAIPWVRPPVELYRMVSMSHSDGADVTYRFHHGDLTYTGQLGYGRNPAEDWDTLIQVSHLSSFFNRLEYGPLSVQAAYVRGKLSVPQLEPLLEGFSAFGPEGEAVARRYGSGGAWSDFVTLGAKYDPGPWFLMAEWGYGDTGSRLGTISSWYASGGYRLGQFMPYLSFAHTGSQVGAVRGLAASSYPGELAARADALNDVLEQSQSAGVAQQTVSGGVRWDFAGNVAAKLQYDAVDVRRGSVGTFGNLAPGFLPRGTDVFSLTLDFVF